MIKKLKYKVRRIEFEPPRENTGVKVFVFLMAALSLIFSYIFCATVSWRPSPMIQHIINVGAVGMMQLMPETAAWISEQSGLTAEKLEEPDQNIPLGAWYLNFLLKTYHNNEILALAAYNAGRGNVDEWIKENGWEEGFSDIERIPFPETREFVKSVVTARDRLVEKDK